MSEPIQLRIPTNSLMKLLEGNPEIIAKLESMASEKIAEEIMRKATSSDLKKLTDATVSNAMDEVRRAMRNGASWPTEVRDAVKKMVMEHLKDQRVTMITEFRDELTKMFNTTQENAVRELDKKIEDLTLAHREHLRTYARRDFLAVMKEVREGLDPQS